jgi:pyruvate ferredoxin oxidoreductase gamma subunit
MKEIRIHGRGGQGSVTAADLISISGFASGKYGQGFPAFGVERRGAPVLTFARLSDKPMRVRYQVYEPDYVMVLDATLVDIVNVAAGLKDGGTIIINSKEPPEYFSSKIDAKAKIVTVDATGMALEITGVPIVNTVMLGAFAAATGEMTVESVQDAVKKRFAGEVGEKNAKAVRATYDFVKEGMK